MQTLADWRRASGHWADLRAHQARQWFEDEVRRGVLGALEKTAVKTLMSRYGEAVSGGTIFPEAAAAAVLAAIAGL